MVGSSIITTSGWVNKASAIPTVGGSPLIVILYLPPCLAVEVAKFHDLFRPMVALTGLHSLRRACIKNIQQPLVPLVEGCALAYSQPTFSPFQDVPQLKYHPHWPNLKWL